MIQAKSFDNLSDKRISFILATKNRSKLLKKAFKHFSKIIGTNDELIIIDGGSTDQTVEVVKSNRKIIDVYLSEPDVNPTQAYNKGILLSKGKYIKFLCDDDIVFKDSLEKAVNVLEVNPEIDVLVCGGIMTNKKLHRQRIIYIPPGSNYGKSLNDPFVLGGNGVGLLIRRGSLSRVGLFKLDWISDASFLVSCIKQGLTVKFCRLKLFHAYVQESSITSHHLQGVEKDIANLMKENASKKIYYRYQFNHFLFKHKFINNLMTPLKLVIKLIHKLKRIKNRVSTSQKYFWDGGLS